MSKPVPARVVSHGYLLYEYIADDNIYILVGIIDSALGGHCVDEETGKGTDEIEADEYMRTGEVDRRVEFVKDANK